MGRLRAKRFGALTRSHPAEALRNSRASEGGWRRESLQCVELLKRAESIFDGGGFVFAGRTPKAPLSNTVFLMLLRRMQRHDITAHGFRSSFRDWAAERTNTPRAVVEASLAHVVKDRTEAAYFRSDLFELRRALMDKWVRFATAKPAAVVQIRA